MNDLIATIEQLQAEARDGMKRASRDSDPYLYQYLVGKFHAFGKVAGILKKQEEPHYTKRNALFDKCVENCDPEIMKRVSDEVDEMLEKEQKPAEWSEEDEERLINTSISFLKDFADKGYENAVECIDWLKSLRPQSKEELTKTLQDEYNKGKETGEREGYTKGYNKGYKDAEEAYNESVSYHLNIPDNWPPKMPDLPTQTTTNGI